MLSVRAYRGEYGAHSHAHAQVLMGIRGNLQLEVDGHPAFVDPSCGLVIPAGARHGYLAEAPVQVVVVDCDAARGTDRLRRFALPSRWPSQRASWAAEALLSELAAAPTLQARRRSTWRLWRCGSMPNCIVAGLSPSWRACVASAHSVSAPASPN